MNRQTAVLRPRGAFTLIELLVVIAIIAILAAKLKARIDVGENFAKPPQ